MNQILATKLAIPPLRTETIHRARLIENIVAGLDRKLTLISAPAGFGKTTLLSECTAKCGRPTAWISLDDGDNEPRRFLAYLIAALQNVDPSIGISTQKILESPQPPPIEILLTDLINTISDRTKDFILIIDDYHVIENHKIDNAINFILTNLPAHLHLVIGSRTDPSLPLPNLRARRHLNEIRSEELRFSISETTTFLNKTMGLNLTKEDIAALDKRTEGWIVGLQLAALSMQRLTKREEIIRFIDNLTSSHRFILDYLIDEVLRQRPEGTQDFLLRTSILERMCASLCNAITGRDDSQKILMALENANLFIIPLDDDRDWYRYHHLFGDLLSKRLIQTQAGLAQELHRRAASWFEENDLYSEAIDHSLAAEDFDAAARLVENSARQMLERSELAQILKWVNTLPEEYTCTRPWLCTYHAWALRLTGGQYEAVESLQDNVDQAIQEYAERSQGSGGESSTFITSDEEYSQLIGHHTAIRAYQALYREDLPAAIEFSHQALEYQPKGDFIRSSIALALGWAYRFSGNLTLSNKALEEAKTIGLASGNIYLAVAATCRAAHNLALGGRLKLAAEMYNDAIKLTTMDGGGHFPVAGYAYVYLGGIFREWGNLDLAERYLQNGIGLCKQVGYILDQIIGNVNLARVHQAQGKITEAYNALQSAEKLSQMMKGYVFARRWVEDYQIRLWTIQGNMGAIEHWLHECDMKIDDDVDFQRELEHIILARALKALGREKPDGSYLEDAMTLLSRLQVIASSAGWRGKEIEILVLQALVFQSLERNVDALVALEKALKLAKPEDYLRTFIDEGKPMLDLLHRANIKGIEPEYTKRLLNAFAVPSKEQVSAPDVGMPHLTEPLSKRELEVLLLIAQGKTNQEIASQLVIAMTTTKKHVSNIIGKLGVSNRTQAVARANELDLL